MLSKKSDIIDDLRKKILPLEGLYSPFAGTEQELGLGPINDFFPQKCFPLGAIHEFITNGAETLAASSGFISGLLSGLMKRGGACVWIGSSQTIFPPALRRFGIEPDMVLFVNLQKEKDILWTMEEALKCKGLSAVVAEIPELNFIASRRFQLAVEQSRVTGFILRDSPRNLSANASVSRWKIDPLPTKTEDQLPGLGFPRWNVELLKIRNGKPGSWVVEWSDERFHFILQNVPSIQLQTKRKTG